MENKLITIVIGAMVAILLTGSLLVPIINDAADDTKVYYNNEFGVLASAGDESIDYTIKYTGNTSGETTEVYINGVKSGSVYNGIRAIVISDSYVVAQSNELTGWNIYVGNSVDSNKYYALTSSDITIRITADSSTISFTDSDGVKTLTIGTEWCYYRDDNSTDFRIVDYTGGADKTVYVNDLSQVRGASLIITTNEFFNFEGTAVNVYGETPETPTMVYEDLTDVMNGVISFNLGAVISGNRTSGVHFDVDNNGEDYTVYPYFLVIPASVYGQTGSDAAYTAILYVLPLMVIVAIIAAIAYNAVRRA